MAERAYLHTGSWCGVFVYPVEVLKRCPKTSVVRLCHLTRIGKERLPRRTVKRVPNYALGEKPANGSLLSVGGGKFVPQR